MYRVALECECMMSECVRVCGSFNLFLALRHSPGRGYHTEKTSFTVFLYLFSITSILQFALNPFTRQPLIGLNLKTRNQHCNQEDKVGQTAPSRFNQLTCPWQKRQTAVFFLASLSDNSYFSLAKWKNKYKSYVCAARILQTR